MFLQMMYIFANVEICDSNVLHKYIDYYMGKMKTICFAQIKKKLLNKGMSPVGYFGKDMVNSYNLAREC